MVKQPINTDKRLENLQPRWKQGESGNPNGRPKSSVTTLLKNTPDADKHTIATKLTTMAKEGDLKAIDMFIDRTDGKVAGDGATINFNEIKILIIREVPKASEQLEEDNATK